MTTPELGIIEGFYGKPWSWEARRETASFLLPYGYRFYIYAPKGDPYLRRRWQEPHPAEHATELKTLAHHCHAIGVRFGIGLSPYEIFNNFDAAARNALDRKLAFFDSLGVQDLAILFDDMRGDAPQLAERQLEIVEWMHARTGASRTIVCPTYYTDDPVLDRVFGQRPPDYLEKMGSGLDPSIEIFWTGEEVCSRAITPGHLKHVSAALRRKPLLWDNYPVNDGQRMSRYLHLRAFTGRPASLSGAVSAHAVNPALQPTLSRIPAITLADSYANGDDYAYGAAFRAAADAVAGPELGRLLWEDILTLQDVGLERLDEAQRSRLQERYQRFDHPAAREVLEWLAGGYGITDEIVRTQ